MDETKKLASYATLKILFGNKQYKSYFELLSEFIKNIIEKSNLYLFSVQKMSLELETEYGFILPISVVNKAIKKIKYVSFDNTNYIVDTSSREYKNRKNNIINIDYKKYVDIIKEICNFANDKYQKNIDIEMMTSDLIAYLIEDEKSMSDPNNIEIISKYILSIENDKNKQELLTSIREGGIIYTGLNNGISDIGVLTKDLTLYLDTEVLFNIVGYNGEIYKQLAIDMINQINKANESSKHIKMKYFKKVKNEVEKFFNTAEDIVENKKPYEEKSAMINIINGCENASDVIEKKSKFYYELSKIGISEDDDYDYYREDNQKNVIESKSKLRESEEYSENIEYLCKINILRRGQKVEEFENCNSIFITETRYALELAEEFKQNCCYSLAMNTNNITNLLWYKLGLGFGCDSYPNNLQAILKAKIVLTNIISTTITKEYEKALTKFKNKEIDKKLLEKQILTLHEKAIMLDSMNYSNIDELMDFSKQYFDNYENGIELKNKEINKAKKELLEYKKISNNEINRKNEQIGLLSKEIEEKNIIINRYEKIEKIRKKVIGIFSYIKKSIKKKRKVLLVYFLCLVLTTVIFLYINPEIIDKTVEFGGILGIVMMFIPITE